ncbi:hypothetical protein HYE82_15705 [Streptomyces sp. BR123]|uniref:2'-5' RNA ligase family protein n=1 Tax=Streptomyces sp. BR123 TaxID=2749828 RepID=UPI0015C4211A|nr:2'-5' RNA ligase family protein [Streptomyces sp. BR123]NXY95811.1 hypothetical protein [Streptomyces sp. BR123]
MDDFFARVTSRKHAWPAGRADLHWHILHTPAAVGQLTDPYRELVDRPGLAWVEERWMHTTILHGGPMQEYRPGEIDAILARVRQECTAVEPFELTYDRPTPGTVAVERAARPGAPGRRLWELTARIDAEVTGNRFPLIPAAWYPHTSLAYGVSGPERPDRSAIKVALSDVQDGPVTLTVDRMALVAQSHDGRHITWEHLADVSLGGSR